MTVPKLSNSNECAQSWMTLFYSFVTIVAAMIAIVVLFFGFFIGNRFVPVYLDKERVDHVLFGAAIPPNSKIIHTRRTPAGAPDRWSFLIFDTDREGVEQFARDYSGGVDLHTWSSSPQESGCTLVDMSDSCPKFDTTRIKRGKFYLKPGTSACVSIDLDTRRVYVFR